ncbi:MAG: hypothetical protein JSR17_05935 [Proteobacteria bacterium]|nr:hypothetical protein [Pseudomonadota bacterium]
MSLGFKTEKRFTFTHSAYTKRYNDHFARTNNIVDALKAALELYIQTQLRPSKENLKDAPLMSALTKFLKHLKTATIGNILYQYHFNILLPSELINLFNLVKHFEIKKIFSSNTEFIKIQNDTLAQNYSPKAVYSGLVKLNDLRFEIQNNKQLNLIVKNHQLGEITAQIMEWEALLTQKFALIIFQATSEEKVNESFNETFTQTTLEHHESLSEIRQEFDCQIEFLSDNEFFEEYYKLKSLEEKYNFVYGFQQSEGKRTTELEETLDCLLIEIGRCAFSPFEKKMHSLMQTCSLEDVMQQLNERLSAHKPSRLKEHLELLLKQTNSEYTGWQKADAYEYPNLPANRPLYQLHVARYGTSDPTLCVDAHLSTMKHKNVK